MKPESILIALFAFFNTVNVILSNEQPTKEDPLKFAKDTGHIKEHLQHQYGFTNEQAEKYLKEYDAQTQFFVMHDYDNNTKLDGLELLKSMTHFHDEHEGEHENEEKKEEVDQTDTLVEFVDMILKDQDYNKDGYIDYPEYISYYTKFDEKNHAGTDVTTETPQA